jgi:hypothetical protein
LVAYLPKTGTAEAKSLYLAHKAPANAARKGEGEKALADA